MSAKKTCFIISTIGEENSEDRKLADEKYDLVFSSVLQELGYEVTRADKIGTPGSISYDIINHIISSDLVIADVSDVNPNVFYELAVRNAVNKPVIVIKAVNQKMPFDIYDKRAISLDMKNARLWTDAKKKLKTQITEGERDKEQASKSILSDFTGQIVVKKETSPDNVELQLKDIKSELRRLRSDAEFNRQYEAGDIVFDDVLPHLSEKSRREVFFMDIMKSLEGEDRTPVREDLLIHELTKTKMFNFESAKSYIRRMLRQADIYECKPGYYNRV